MFLGCVYPDPLSPKVWLSESYPREDIEEGSLVEGCESPIEPIDVNVVSQEANVSWCRLGDANEAEEEEQKRMNGLLEREWIQRM